MKGIAYNGDEIVLVPVLSSLTNNLIIAGNGFSIGDPFISVPHMKQYRNLGNILAMFFKKECSGLEAAQQELAYYINKAHNNYSKVAVYGHSKCGVMFYNMLSLIKQPIISISVSAPFGGCLWADKSQIEKHLNCWGRWLYRSIFSNHKVDQDIIPNSKYLSQKPYIPDYHTAVNVISQCYAFWDELNDWNFREAFFSRLNKIASYEKGDGIVSIESQMSKRFAQEFQIHASHLTSFDRAKFVLRHYLRFVKPT